MMKYGNLIKTSLFVAMGAVLIYFGIRCYAHGVSELDRQATKSFQEALKKELATKHLEVDSLKIRSQIDASTIGQAPKIVTVDSSTGKKEYKISTEMHQKNIVENAEVRILHSIALQKSPIIPDSLNTIWQQTLKESNLMGRTTLCITIAEGNERFTSLKTADHTRFVSTKSLFICYIGYLGEVKIIGFIDYPWWFVFCRYVIIRMLILSAVCVLVYFFVSYVLKTRSRPYIIKEIIVPQLLIGVPKGKVRIYKLTEHLVFDAEQSLLIVDQQGGKRLIPQVCVFLEMLLNAEEYKLSDEMIQKQLWPSDSNTNDRLRKVVSRLRQELNIDPSIELKRVYPYSYQLIL